MTCDECGASMSEAGEIMHRCDPADILARVKVERDQWIERAKVADKVIVDQAILHSRAFRRASSAFVRRLNEARDLAWDTFTGAGWNDATREQWAALEKKRRELFDMWRAEGWKPKGERENDGESQGEA